MSKTAVIDPIGEVYGRLTVVREVERVTPRKRQFLCICSCGKEVSLNLNKLRSGHTRSCGCLHQETILRNLENRPKPKPRHGLNKSPEHQAWVGMRQRCNNPKTKSWEHYGGRGISVCARWQDSFEAFYADVGPRPGKGYSLDRINVDGNYEPGNVRWATQQQQAENTRVAKLVTLEGKTMTLAAWAREKGLSVGQINGRIANGWSMEEAILTPSIPGQKIHTGVKRDYSQRTRDGHGRYRPETD